MKNITIFSVFLLLSAITFFYRPTVSNETDKGVRVIIGNSVDENLSTKILSNITVPTVAITLLTLNIYVSEPVVSEGTNVNLYGSTASNSLYKSKGNEFKSILNDIEMRKLDDTKN